MSKLFDRYYQAVWDCKIVEGAFICDWCDEPLTRGLYACDDTYAWCYECTVKFAKRYNLESRLTSTW